MLTNTEERVDKSKYFQCLSNERKKWYLVKISGIENVDPYILKKENLNFNTECFPKISYPEIVNYLLFVPSPVTAEELKCYKSMEVYSYFLYGWVKEIATKSFQDESCLILGKVSKCYSFKSSQRLHGYYKKYLTVSTFLLPWLKRKNTTVYMLNSSRDTLSFS